MPLKLTIISYQRLSPGQETSKSLDHGSIKIGRAVHNDWVLQDPERIMSKHHCTVTYQGGGYVLTDHSQNGTFLNDSEQRIPKDQTVPLQDGDHFVVGEYEIAVNIKLNEDFQDASEEPVTDIVPPDPDLFASEHPHSDLAQASSTRDTGPDRETPFSIRPSLEDSLLGPRKIVGLSDSAAVVAHAATPAAPDLSTPERINFELPSLVSKVKPTPSIPQPATPALVPTPKQPDVAAQPSEFHTPTTSVPPESALELVLESMPLAETPPTKQPSEPAPPPPPLGAETAVPTVTAASPTPAESLIPEDWWMQSSAAAVETTPPHATVGIDPFQSVPAAAANTASPSPSTTPAAVASTVSPAVAVPHQLPRRPTSTTAVATAADSAALPIDDLLQEFFKGAGLPPLTLSPSQREVIMRTLGGILRETTCGLMDILRARSDVKGEFRLERTAIGPIENNPLKTPPGRPPLSPEQVITLLLVGQQQAYMSPVDAVREGFDDIKAHQLAVMAGIQAALNRLLERFDPANLETRLEQSVLDNLWPANRKAKYWDLFIAEYQAIARETEDDFKELFGDEFARAYEKRLQSH